MRKCVKLFFLVLFSFSVFGETLSYSDLLMNCKTEQMEALDQTKEALDLQSSIQFRSLEGGLTRAKLYCFEKEDQKYVLRFLALKPDEPKEMRQNEIAAQGIGNHLGIAPDLIFVDSEAVLMVMPFIEGHPFRNPSELQLGQLGKRVRSLHDYSGEFPTRYTFQQRLERHYKKGMKMGIAFPTGFDREVLAAINQTNSRSFVPCHGDLNVSNILVSESEIHLIDWTTATWDDPFTELSYFCSLANLSPSQEAVFLKAYFGREPNDEELKILQEEKAKVYLLTALIWLRFGETAEEAASPLQERIAALDEELHSESLKPIDVYLRDGMADLHTAPKAEIQSCGLSFYKAYLQERTTFHEDRSACLF